MTKPFWEEKQLSDMSNDEWEALCDGCGKCCLLKLEDEDTADIVFTNLSCRYCDLNACSCTRYPERSRLVPDCLDLRANFENCAPWLPSTCAYKRLATGQPLASWHYLICGSRETIHEAGVSIRSYAQSEDTASEDITEHILNDWLP